VVSSDSCLEPITRQDIQDLRDLGANLINASYPGVFGVEPPYEVDSVALAYLDDLVGWAEEVNIYIAIHYRTGPGRNEAAIHMARGAVFDVWSDQSAHDAWVEMWRFTAERYRDSPVVVGYNLMVEPHPNVLIDPDGDLEPVVFQGQVEGTLMDWSGFAAELTAAIREVDPLTPIIVNSLNWGSAAWFPALEPTGDPRTVYSLHAYDPDVYTVQDVGETSISYPDVVEDSGEVITFDHTWLDENYQPALEFERIHGVPVYVGEFGAVRWVPGVVEFLRDQTELFEAYGWNYAVYVWRGDEPDFDGFNLEYGTDPEKHGPSPDNPLLGVYLQRWIENEEYPGEPMAFDRVAQEFAAVDHWLYLIDVNLDSDTVDKIAASTHDMVVLDFIPSERNNTDYPMEGVVARLHAANTPKLVLAYIDIGQAEDYRTYWQPGWRIGDPDWIAGGDPDGWEGNFPVAFWHDEWRDIWLAPDGYLQGIVDAGFDGVYLDWVEAYSDENVVALADRDGVEARQEMISWVQEIAEFGRSKRPHFVVVAQNAAELAQSDEYAGTIDAIAQEQVWFDGGADNDPPGDCPLPRTEADVDTVSYRDALSPPCRRQFDDYPASTLHVSSEEYLRDLLLARGKGLTIFTVDYALEPENVAWVYETSRSLGFVPYVGSRALDSYAAPVP
jgi:cysteinyl-tRNA synthetase